MVGKSSPPKSTYSEKSALRTNRELSAEGHTAILHLRFFKGYFGLPNHAVVYSAE